MKGTVKKILGDKGFGFISPENGGQDVFFHTKDCTGGDINALHEGDPVTFEMGSSPKGPKATGVAAA